ncbi:MAG: hypothetical protein HOI70_01060, partial [Opitutae bacterium]|nr:hypothetical protein [Opitutae bacterium]
PNWQETEYSTDNIGIANLYEEHPEITGEDKNHSPQPPIIRSELAEILQDGIYILRAEILDNGNSPVSEVGFIVSDSIRFEIPIRLMANIEQNIFFSASLSDLAPNRNYFFRAYAINQSGESFSSIKKFKTETPPSWHGNSVEMEAGWIASEWFGSFLPLENDWIYHQELGWAYTIPDGNDGIWIWTQEYNWQWTRPDVWPFLYRDQTANWLYFIKRINGQPIFYDYSELDYLISPAIVP